ncbi:uncharacterized protein LOC129134385 [Agelaius phoeniceus]|uniref:uncharacterized protein LOC129134385 n=1 Tax=Agelaius phoeniceus TaxID=39638 RepID=UPI004054B380
MALGGLAHALAYRYLAGAHAAFLDKQDRELRAAYERARSRAGSHEELLKRLRGAEAGPGRGRGRQRGGGRGGVLTRPVPPPPPTLGPLPPHLLPLPPLPLPLRAPPGAPR